MEDDWFRIALMIVFGEATVCYTENMKDLNRCILIVAESTDREKKNTMPKPFCDSKVDVKYSQRFLRLSVRSAISHWRFIDEFLL